MNKIQKLDREIDELIWKINKLEEKLHLKMNQLDRLKKRKR